ncbi:putative O-linked N-acetylglucosamine transferase (SPINDLY family) [Thiogranum longum]|uniref:protein O-GlcNAc transferase n=1 Tax=Thiogranum longum TaxID=1537524 RepID=A0A4R1HG60_9GAMM|nr:tetratricopeptide repeat protein [Thiogranum longum]TCK19385.1 putative O-linked N-acetylglucosamine transferase (SPINDLY family) [Thiogranum longum]
MAKKNIRAGNHARSRKRQIKLKAAAAFQAGHFKKARLLYERICKISPGDGEAWYLLGKTHIALGSLQEAEKCLRKAVAITPDSAHAMMTLGELLDSTGKLGESIGCYERALSIEPTNVTLIHKLASAMMKQGRVTDAIPLLRQVLSIKPEAMGARSCLLSALNYCQQDVEEVFHAHVQWGQARERQSVPAASVKNDLAADKRPLRIGYVSPDFCAHPVFFFIVNLLANHDPANVRTFCYSDVLKPDAITTQLHTVAHVWRDIQLMTDDEVADLVRRDQIDILVDLAGHTARNRLSVFARKVAPVQVSYLGYPNTTGLSAMGYRFTDAWADPPGQTEHLHTEALVRLPGGFLCYNPLQGSPASPPLTPSPCQVNGYITFGSFNNLAKITPEVLELWSEILCAVPGSHLVLKNRPLSDAVTREYFYSLFEGHGIGRERLELIGWIPNMGQHMSTYNKVDIALDTFLYNGTTTTCQAIWMGVPVITLAGQAHAGRVGVSLLSQLGLDQFITHGAEQYRACATALARDTKTLGVLRAGLRERMATSHLCDGKQFARQIESAYRDMWETVAEGISQA